MPVADAEMWVMFFMFLGSAMAAAISIILNVVAFVFSPARTWIRAKIKNKPIIAARRRDRKVHHILADDYTQGLVTSKEYGSFIVDPDSVYMSKKGGVPILPVNSEVGLTLRPDVLRMIDGLKRMGIDNIEEAQALEDVWGKCDCGYEGPMKPVNIGDDKKPEIVLACPYEHTEVKNDDKKESGTGEGNHREGDAQRDKDKLPDSGPSDNV